jgi:hypothetical protein
LNNSETQHFLIIELGFVPQPNLQILSLWGLW